MIRFLIGFAAGVYTTGFVGTFIVNMDGPITPGLALLRAFVWPLWMATGKPEGQRLG